jgi:hypothetical protein
VKGARPSGTGGTVTPWTSAPIRRSGTWPRRTWPQRWGLCSLWESRSTVGVVRDYFRRPKLSLRFEKGTWDTIVVTAQRIAVSSATSSGPGLVHATSQADPRRWRPRVAPRGLAALPVAHLREWWVADDLPGPAAQRDARHWQSLDRTGYQAAMLSLWSDCCFAWKRKRE